MGTPLPPVQRDSVNVKRLIPLTLKVKKLVHDAIMPKRATAGAACFDFHAHIPLGVVAIAPGERAQIPTGLACEVPEGYVMMLYSRSGHGAKHGVRLGNCVGVTDSDYRGQILLILTNDGQDTFEVKHGERFAQGMLQRVFAHDIVEVEELTSTARGVGGLGSTGS